MQSALDVKVEGVIQACAASFNCASEMVAQGHIDHKHARDMLDLKKAEVQHVLQQLMAEDEG